MSPRLRLSLIPSAHEVSTALSRWDWATGKSASPCVPPLPSLFPIPESVLSLSELIVLELTPSLL